MNYRKIKRVGIVGTGVIGASWASLILAHGFDVIATDPAPEAEDRLRRYICESMLSLKRLGVLTKAEVIGNLKFVQTLEECIAAADFIQENGPERASIKQETFRKLDAAAPPDVLLASSTSGFRPSELQAGCRYPGRVLIGHPFNPPHLIPLVEIVGGKHSSDEALAHAEAFYRALGKVTIRLKREMLGHVSNRLQAALWREAYHLVNEGVVSAADVDVAIAHGPGLRWALMGPIMLGELAGGQGGLKHFLDHIGPMSEAIWDDLGSPRLTETLKAKLVIDLEQQLSRLSREAMIKERDDLLVDLIVSKGRAKNLP